MVLLYDHPLLNLQNQFLSLLRISTCCHCNKHIMIKKAKQDSSVCRLREGICTQVSLPARIRCVHMYICQIYTADQVCFVLHSSSSSEGGTIFSSTHVFPYMIHSLSKIPKGGALGYIVVPTFFHDSINLIRASIWSW